MTMISNAPTELGNERIGKLLKMYAVPGIIAQTAASLYNMVDSIYIGHIKDVGSYAISGLAVTFPLMNLSTALGTLVGVGSMTLVSMLLGQRQYDKARSVLGNALSLNTIIGFIFGAVALLFLDPILRFFGASDSTLPFARDYMTIILIGNVFTHLYFGFNGIIRAAGHPRTAMGLTLFTVASNAVLDPLFIFVFGLGIKGAAIATVLCQIMALCYTMKFLMNKESFFHFPKPMFQLDRRVAISSIKIGISPFLMNTASCIVALFINQQLLKYGGDLAIGAYGIGNRVTFVFFMIVMGINQGMQPIAGYNFGAQKYSRVREVFLLSVKWAVLITTLCWVVSVFFPATAASIFTSDPELVSVSSRGLRLMNIGFALVGLNVVTGNFFQSIGMVKTAIFLSLSRQLLFLVPLLYLLPLKLGQDGVWLSFPISDVLSIIISFCLAYRQIKRF